MIPESIFVYENGDVAVEERFYGKDLITYFVKGGVGAIGFDPYQLDRLTEILVAIRDDTKESLSPSLGRRLASASILLLILSLFVIMIVGLAAQ